VQSVVLIVDRALVAFIADRVQTARDRFSELFVAGYRGDRAFGLVVDHPVGTEVIGPKDDDVVE
jgi:hypothetical protein